MLRLDGMAIFVIHQGINFPISNIPTILDLNPQSSEGMLCYASNKVLLGRISTWIWHDLA